MNEQGQGLQDYPVHLQPNFSSTVSLFPYKGRRFLDTWFSHYALQYSSQILKHLRDFPLPQCWFGYYSRLTASKYAWLNIAEGEGQM